MDKTQKKYLGASDEDLVVFFKQGDIKAYNQLYERYKKKVFNNLVYRRYLEPADAEDMIADVFLGIYQNLKNLEDDANFEKYLWRSIRNATINLSNKKGRENFIKQMLKNFELRNLPHIIEWFGLKRLEGDRFISAKEIFTHFLNCVETLNEKHRDIYDMTMSNKNYSYEEIGGEFDIKTETAKKRIYNARVKVKDCVKSRCGGY